MIDLYLLVFIAHNHSIVAFKKSHQDGANVLRIFSYWLKLRF